MTGGPAGTVCQLLLADGTANEFTPLPLVANLRAAAREVGFRPGDSVGLPDGRTVTVWERSGDGC